MELRDTHKHENGFIGLVSQYGVIQLGKQEEADGENYEASEELFNGYSLFQDDHGTSYQNPENTTQGTLEVKNVAGYNVMALKGGQATSGYWNGGMRTLTIPVDSEGQTWSEELLLLHPALVRNRLDGGRQEHRPLHS